jgi:predicted ester cyclase
MTKADLADLYRGYIACLNKQDWPQLGRFVHEEVHYNGERIGLSGYREMLIGDFRAIPDLSFDIHLLISDHRVSQAVCASTARRQASCSACRSTGSASRSPKTSSMSFETNGSRKYGR